MLEERLSTTVKPRVSRGTNPPKLKTKEKEQQTDIDLERAAMFDQLVDAENQTMQSTNIQSTQYYGGQSNYNGLARNQPINSSYDQQPLMIQQNNIRTNRIMSAVNPAPADSSNAVTMNIVSEEGHTEHILNNNASDYNE